MPMGNSKNVKKCLYKYTTLIMRKNAFLTSICILCCLTLNYTFPLHGDFKLLPARVTRDSDLRYWNSLGHHANIIERSKKMVNDIGHVFRKMKDTSSKNDSNKDADKRLNEVDLRQYEQLVIMKKYPYLDLKELEFKLSPLSNKNTRQSLRFDPGSNIQIDSSLYEPEIGPNVEISNRGLSGFAIPTKLIKTGGAAEDKPKLNDLKGNEEKAESSVNFSKKSSKRQNWSSPEKGFLKQEQNWA